MYYKRVHINGSRFYRITGRSELFPSVTTILSVIGKKFISRWETGLALGKFRSRVEERVVDGSVAEISAQEMDVWFEVCNFLRCVIFQVSYSGGIIGGARRASYAIGSGWRFRDSCSQVF